jgi:hypothetical protein
MGGVNRKLLPYGEVSVHPDGHLTLALSGGRRYELRADGTLASFGFQGNAASFRGDGSVASIHTPNLDITRPLAGGSTITSRRADGSVLVSTGLRSGYLELAASPDGRSLVLRTYLSGTTSYTRVFTTHRYNRAELVSYVPSVYYAPEFYGWLYADWAALVSYIFDWHGQAWCDGVNPYFAPYAAYPNGYSWLTDYYVGQTMAEPEPAPPSKENNAAAPAAGDKGQAQHDIVAAEASTAISPEVKAAIAAEVQHQLAYESAASSDTLPAGAGELPSALTPNYNFVVASNLDVATADQHTCGLSAGDVLVVVAPPTENATAADLRVVAAKRGDCPAGVQVSVALQELQNMLNNMRARIDEGMLQLRTSQGTGGLPAAPPSTMTPPRPALADVPPFKDDGVGLATLLEEQRQQAARAEVALDSAAFPPPASKPADVVAHDMPATSQN